MSVESHFGELAYGDRHEAPMWRASCLWMEQTGLGGRTALLVRELSHSTSFVASEILHDRSASGDVSA